MALADDKPHFSLHTYMGYFRQPDATKPAGYVRHLYRKDLVHAVARFRLYSHNLLICTKGWEEPRIPRKNRKCPCCDLDRDDEKHVFFCPDEACMLLRRQYEDILDPVIGTNDAWMRKLMNPAGAERWQRLAHFLLCFTYQRERMAREPVQRALPANIRLPDEL